MNKKLLLISVFTFFSLKMSAQFELLDEPEGSNLGIIYSLSVYDNDILYSFISNTNNGKTNGVFIGNGNKDDRVELLKETNSRAYFHATIGQSELRLHEEGKYTTGKDVYAKIIQPTNSNSVYKLSPLRNSFIPENRFTASSASGSDNVNLVANDGLITIDTITEGGNNKLLLRHFIKNSITSETREYKLSKELFNAKPRSFFSWNKKLFFVADVNGEKDLYKADALGDGDVRVTQNKVSKPTSFKGVNPNSFLLSKEYIYFLGRDGFYTEITPGPVKRNYPTAVCYTNGDIDFGSTDTGIYNGDDGSLGYKSYTETEHSEVVLGKVNQQILYYVKGSFGGSFLALPSRESLGIKTESSTQTFKFIQLKNKVYILSRLGYKKTKLYSANGLLNNTKSFEPPFFSGSIEPLNSFGPLKINNDKVYFLAKYTVSGVNRFQLLSYIEGESEIKVAFVFPEGIDVNMSNFYAHTTGFVFTTNNGKIYTWNIEKRSKIINPNNTTRGGVLQNIANFKYQQINYSVELKSTAKEVKKVRTQILDTLSNQYKFEIVTLPNQYEKKYISTLFYNIGSIEATTTLNKFEIELSYKNEMFSDKPIIDVNKLTVLIYENGAWKEVTPTSFNKTNQTITLNESLSNNAYIFLKLNQVLSTGSGLNTISNQVSMYPNPTSEKITLHSKTTKFIDEVQMFSVLGKTMFESSFKNTTKTVLNLPHLKKGVYVVKIRSGKTIFSDKLIID
ncbi:T9SS type A sorting domain-containing protein [Tenacibaculum halocynthiae]|uniref:T9SS type A sorting domain-containing protein n=1 Tax=Tenacibaculum halocynthiae TaxID=1254437 RepID=UPI003893BF7C